MNHLRKRWPVLFLALASLFPFWRCLFLGEAIGPWDQIRAMSPWNGPIPTQPWDVLQADGVIQFAPWRALVFSAWSKGQMPFWNPYQLMGTPLLGNSQSAGFYPPHILMGLIHVPLYPAMVFLAWLHLFWAGLGVFLIVRRLGGTRTGGCIAGASFTLSAFMISWTALPSVITTVSWIPWVLASVLAIFQSNPFWQITQGPKFSSGRLLKDAAETIDRAQRSRDRWMISLMVCVAMMILAGHLQFVAFGMMAAVLLMIILTISLVGQRTETKAKAVDPNRKPIPSRKNFFVLAGATSVIRCLMAIALGFCIAAPQLLPVLAFSKQSHRRSSPTSEGYSAYTASAIRPFEWIGLEFPKLLGDPSASVGDTANRSQFWPEYVKPGDSFGECALSIGPLILLLLCFLPKAAWKRGAPIALVGMLGILIACGTPVDILLYYGIPGWSSTGSPGRGIVLFVLAACILGGLAVRPKQDRHPNDRARLAKGSLAFAGITLLLLGAAFAGLQSVESFAPGLAAVQPIIALARSEAMPIALVAMIIVLGAGAAWRRRGDAAKMLLLSASVVVPSILTFGILRTGQPIKTEIPTPSMDRYAFINSGWNLFGIPAAIMPPNMATLLGIHDVAGYDSLLDKNTKALLDNANKTDSSPPENGNMMFVKPSATPQELATLGVSIVEFRDRSGQVQQVPTNGPGRASTPQGPATIQEENTAHILVKATGPGPLTLRDRKMPGWEARVDGQPAAIKDGPFMLVDLGAGEHTVAFQYTPPGLNTGLILFLVGLLVLVSILIRVGKGPKIEIP